MPNLPTDSLTDNVRRNHIKRETIEDDLEEIHELLEEEEDDDEMEEYER